MLCVTINHPPPPFPGGLFTPFGPWFPRDSLFHPWVTPSLAKLRLSLSLGLLSSLIGIPFHCPSLFPRCIGVINDGASTPLLFCVLSLEASV